MKNGKPVPIKKISASNFALKNRQDKEKTSISIRARFAEKQGTLWDMLILV
ncbi:hypothetical protein QMP26_21835 [Enterocloster clostridioformis]